MQQRCDAATRGPWVYKSSLSGDMTIPAMAGPEVYPVAWCYQKPLREKNANAEFIAHAREDFPKVITALRAMTTDRDRWYESFVRIDEQLRAVDAACAKAGIQTTDANGSTGACFEFVDEIVQQRDAARAEAEMSDAKRELAEAALRRTVSVIESGPNAIAHAEADTLTANAKTLQELKSLLARETAKVVQQQRDIMELKTEIDQYRAGML